ncbi:hypothetical protein BJ165DRAFT_1525412 [Panaeolus papilionaceus]|nr:hypothetical protein BJ165DRAFT_1525412 [Panaeolus papilionaceus]
MSSVESFQLFVNITSTDDRNVRPNLPRKCPVAMNMMVTPDTVTSARPAPPTSSNRDTGYLYQNHHTEQARPPVFPETSHSSSFKSDADNIEGWDTGDDIDNAESTPTQHAQSQRDEQQPWHGHPNDQESNFTERAAQNVAQAAGVGAAYTLNAARIGVHHGLKAANIGAKYAVDAAKKVEAQASRYRLLSGQFWKAPIEGLGDVPKELVESGDDAGTSAEGEKDPGRDVTGMRNTCEKAREYDGKLRNRLLGGVYEYLTDTAILFALSSSLTLNALFRPLEKQRAYRSGVPMMPSPNSIPFINADSHPIITSPFGVDIGTDNQAKWVKLLLVDSMALSLIALIIGYSAMGIVQAFDPWGWMASSETGNMYTSQEGQGFKVDFNDPSHAAQSSSLSQKLQLQARKSQFRALKMRLPLIYLFPRIFQVALLFFVCGFVDLMWFVWTNEVGFATYFKGLIGSSAVVPLAAAATVAALKKVMGVRAS